MENRIIIWGSSKCKQINKIRNLQNKAVRMVCNGNFRAHSDPIYSRPELLDFKHLLVSKLVYLFLLPIRDVYVNDLSCHQPPPSS